MTRVYVENINQFFTDIVIDLVIRLHESLHLSIAVLVNKWSIHNRTGPECKRKMRYFVSEAKGKVSLLYMTVIEIEILLLKKQVDFRQRHI